MRDTATEGDAVQQCSDELALKVLLFRTRQSDMYTNSELSKIYYMYPFIVIRKVIPQIYSNVC